MSSRALMPYASRSGDLMVSAGKKSSKLVLDVFDMIGGVEAMAQWAQENPDKFYTQLFAKTITREADVHHTVGVEDMLDELEAAEEEGFVIDGDYEELTTADEE